MFVLIETTIAKSPSVEPICAGKTPGKLKTWLAENFRKQFEWFTNGIGEKTNQLGNKQYFIYPIKEAK